MLDVLCLLFFVVLVLSCFFTFRGDDVALLFWIFLITLIVPIFILIGIEDEQRNYKIYVELKNGKLSFSDWKKSVAYEKYIQKSNTTFVPMYIYTR